MEKKNEENFEEELHSKSIEDMDSCSSSILDSEEEEDGINVTIKAASSEMKSDLADQKLAGSERRKMKKMIADGMDVDEAHASVSSSTPKRQRNKVSPNGSTDLKPDPKKVCGTAVVSRSAEMKKAENGGGDSLVSTVSPLLEGDALMSEGAGDRADSEADGNGEKVAVGEGGELPGSSSTKKKKNKKKKSKQGGTSAGDSVGVDAGGADGVGTSAGAGGAGAGGAGVGGTGVGGAGVGGAGGEEPGTGGAGKPEKKKNGDAQGGSAIKKPRKEVLPAPTFLQIVSRVKLGIIPAGYPDIELTVEQQEAVKEELLKKVLSQRHEKFKPKFVYCKAKAGHVMLSCQDKNTASWVKTTVPAIVPWENAQLSALEEAEIPRKDVLLAFFYRSKDDENDTILGYLESQNDDLDTSAWRIIHRTVKNDHVGWVFSVDSASMRLLEKWQFVVNYKFGQTLFRKRRPNNGVHPADEDSDGEMEVDPFYEELPSDAKPGEGEMAHSEPGKEAADGKSYNQQNDFAGDDIIQNPRALTAQGSNDGIPSKINNKQNDLSGKDCLTNPRALNAQGSDGDSSRIEEKHDLIQGDHQPKQKVPKELQKGGNGQQ